MDFGVGMTITVGKTFYGIGYDIMKKKVQLENKYDAKIKKSPTKMY